MPSPLFPSSLSDLLRSDDFRGLLTGTFLPEFLPRQRWFTSKGKTIESCVISHVFPCNRFSSLQVIAVRFTDGSREDYQLPLALLADDRERSAYRADHPQLVLGEVAGAGLLVDAVPRADFRGELFELMRTSSQTKEGLSAEAGKQLCDLSATPESIVPAIDTSNTAIIYGDRFFFKLFRKLDPGINPDLELVRFLSEFTDFAHCPPYGGSLGVGGMESDDYLNLGLLTGKVDNRGDAWELFQELTQGHLQGRRERVDAATLERARLLGRRTAEMHRALASSDADRPALVPEPMTADYRREITDAARKLLDRQMEQLERKLDSLEGEARRLANQVISNKEQLVSQLSSISERPMEVDLIRLHGDYHLGQVLYTDTDFTIIDFEGEPLLSIPERRRKRPALKDVAGMVRSFHYAAMGQILLNPDRYADREADDLRRRATDWFETVSGAYLESYFSTCGDAAFLPATEEDRQALLNLFILEKAVYEVAYELNSRPAWLPIPLEGVLFALPS